MDQITLSYFGGAQPIHPPLNGERVQ